MTRGPLLLGVAALLALLVGCTPNGPIVATVTAAGVDPDRPGYLIATGSVSGLS